MLRKGVGLYFLLALFLASLGVWIAFDQLGSREDVLAEREQAALQTSEIIAQSLSAVFLSTNYVLSDVIGAIDSDELVYPPTELLATERLNAFLRHKSNTVPALSGIALYNRDCILTARAVGGTLGFRLDDAMCTRLRALRDDLPHIEIADAQTAPTGKPGILIMRNLPFLDDTFNGGLTAGIGLAFIQKWLESFPLAQKNTLSIVDNTRVLIARVPPLPDAVGKRSNASDFQSAFDSGASHYTMTTSSPRDGLERIFGMSKTEGFPFYVIVGFDKATALHEWQTRAVQVWVGYALLVVLFALLVRSHRIAIGQRELLARLVRTDELTGIANRRHFLEVARQELDRSVRYSRPMSILYIDIDRFKLINDTWGHPAGDAVLKALAREVTGVLRRQDTVARIGGEEFAVLLPETEAKTAAAVAESLRLAIEQATVRIGEKIEIKYTLSIGITSLLGEDDTLDAMMLRADKALYQAKQGGRNQVVAG